MECIYYVSFVYLDKRGNERFGDTIYSHASGIKTENDVKDIASILRMHYGTNHLRVLSFSLLKSTDTYSNLKNLFKEFLFEFFSGSRLKQKMRAWRNSRGRRKRC